MSQKNHQRTLALFMTEIWNAGDFSNLPTYIPPSYQVIDDPGDPWDGQSINRQTFRQRVMYSRNAFPDLHFLIEQMIDDQNTVAIRWQMSGTHLGDLPQLPASGRPFSIGGMTFYDFAEGQISGHRQAFDRLGFLAQIGVLKNGQV